MNFRNTMTFDDKLGVPRTMEEMDRAIEVGYIIPAFKDGILTVDKLLDHADVVLDWYIPSEDSIDFMNFIRLSLGEEPENTNPKAHYFMIDCIFKSETVRPYFQVRNIDYDLLKDRVLVLCTREFSKLHSDSTKILTYDGFKAMGDIQIGDRVINRYGKIVNVIAKSEPMTPKMYKITLADGSSYEVGEDHLNIVWKERRKNREAVMTTKELLQYKLYREPSRKNKQSPKKEYKFGIPLVDPIEFEHSELDIEPYFFGYGLANASFLSKGKVSCHADDMMELCSIFGKKGFTISSMKIYGYNEGQLHFGKNYFKNYSGIDSKNKYIPHNYLFGSIEQRIELLRGLMDGDGTTGTAYKTSKSNKRSITYDSYSEQLAKDVVHLVRSLGGISHITKYEYENTIRYSVVVNIKINPFKLKRKAIQWKPTRKTNRAIVSIDEIPCTETGHCIMVDSEDKSYIVEDGFTVTHNSTLLGSYLVLYMAAKGELPGFGKVNYMLYVSDSMRNNVKTTMETIGSVYRESEYLRGLFESARTVQDEINFVRNPTTKREVALYNEFVNKRGLKPEEVPGRMKRTFSMSGLGASTGGRGSREGLDRPDGVFFDDLLGSEADASSDVILDNIDSTIESDILPAMSGNGSFKLFAGTPYNKNDPAYKRIEDGSWLPVVFPKAERMDETVTESNFRGVWPDRHSYKRCKSDFIKAKRADDSGNPVPLRKLNQEYYLRISNDADRMVTDEMIGWFNRESIARESWKYNWYMTTDYTTTGSKGSDYSGAALWAVDWDGNHYLVDLTLRKLELEAQYRETFAMAGQTVGNTRGLGVGVETDGQQSLHIDALKKRMTDNNIYFSFTNQKGKKIGDEGIRSRLEGGNKHWRFRMMLPMFQNHKIHFAIELKYSSDMNELLDEIKYCTYNSIGSTHDDGLDIISQIGMMDIIFPPKDAESDQPKKRIGMKPGGINEKIWNKKANEENATAYDSYNG